MKKLIFASLACVLMIVACKKDDSSNDNTTTTATTSTTATTGTTDPTEKIIEIKTSFGIMYMWLNKETPLHRDNFLSLAGTSFFDSTTFHRCVANFVIQGVIPTASTLIQPMMAQVVPAIPFRLRSTLQSSNISTEPLAQLAPIILQKLRAALSFTSLFPKMAHPSWMETILFLARSSKVWK
jgi:hypothetical protein